jgi:hypothetical protein
MIKPKNSIRVDELFYLQSSNPSGPALISLVCDGSQTKPVRKNVRNRTAF